ncbi:unnamed protein product, partial [Vitis vinifera]|uniref:Uncharacterized protein n=1 Tax=Vitis vinifera TaxID=29760 RepID=D7SKR4_VITVI
MALLAAASLRRCHFNIGFFA